LLAQIRQCVQLLAHDEDKYKATSITVLAEIMMRFPVLVDCVVNNILSIYNKPVSEFFRSDINKLGMNYFLHVMYTFFGGNNLIYGGVLPFGYLY
jgi:hypothetical protein